MHMSTHEYNRTHRVFSGPHDFQDHYASDPYLLIGLALGKTGALAMKDGSQNFPKAAAFGEGNMMII